MQGQKKGIVIPKIHLFHKLISNAPYCKNIFRCIRICFYLFTKLSYECHDIAFVQKISFLPYCMINLFFCKNFATVGSKEKQDVKLFWSEQNFCSVFYNFSFFTEYFKFFNSDFSFPRPVDLNSSEFRLLIRKSASPLEMRKTASGKTFARRNDSFLAGLYNRGDRPL